MMMSFGFCETGRRETISGTVYRIDAGWTTYKLDYDEEYIPASQLIEKISQSYELEPLKNKKNKSDGPAKNL